MQTGSSVRRRVDKAEIRWIGVVYQASEGFSVCGDLRDKEWVYLEKTRVCACDEEGNAMVRLVSEGAKKRRCVCSRKTHLLSIL